MSLVIGLFGILAIVVMFLVVLSRSKTTGRRVVQPFDPVAHDASVRGLAARTPGPRPSPILAGTREPLAALLFSDEPAAPTPYEPPSIPTCEPSPSPVYEAPSHAIDHSPSYDHGSSSFDHGSSGGGGSGGDW